MWNDTDIPLGYLLTFRCYGTWLHGDDRGSTDRFHNRYKTPHLAPSARRQSISERLLKFAPVVLDARQRKTVESALREVCEYRGWLLHAVSVRTNHVHLVVSTGGIKPERALNSFKAYATRRLRADGNWIEQHSPWADRGSKRRLWNERNVSIAIDYVINGQGGDLPEFE
jgi:REP element-mobilizing transposase RayT